MLNRIRTSVASVAGASCRGSRWRNRVTGWARDQADYRQRQRQHVLSLIRKLDVDHLEIRTDRPYLPTLVDFFQRRRRRFRR